MKIEIYPPLFIQELGQRDNQEDSLWPLDATVDSRLFILCDGMGGHEHGEVASQTVCQALGKWFQQFANSEKSISKEQIREAIEYAYSELDKYGEDNPRQMGTTLTLLYIGRNGITAAHMGDSRIYHIRPSEGLKYQSRDHSLVFDLFQAGEITFEEMATYPKKNIVTRAMTPGEDNRMRADMVHITDIRSGDYFYLCSDGMLEQMSNSKLLSLFSTDGKDETKRQQLMDATTKNIDNHSAWIIHIKDVVKEESDDQLDNEESTARCNALTILPPEQIEDDVVVVSESTEEKSLFRRLLNVFGIK